jgi:hypothetical protein
MKILLAFFIISILFLSILSINITPEYSNRLAQNDYNKAYVKFTENKELLLTRKPSIINTKMVKSEMKNDTNSI